MNQIYVPEAALRNHLTFKEWYERVAYQLFEDAINHQNKFDISKLDHGQRVDLIEKIMRHTNNIFFDNPELIDYKTKNRKWNCRKTDIISTTCVILLSNFKITYKAVGELIGIGHATVIYYIKRHAGCCASSNYKAKYLKLLTQLQYERIIPTIKNSGHQPQQLVSTLLSGIGPKARATDSGSNRSKEASTYGDALARLGIKR